MYNIYYSYYILYVTYNIYCSEDKREINTIENGLVMNIYPVYCVKNHGVKHVIPKLYLAMNSDNTSGMFIEMDNFDESLINKIYTFLGFFPSRYAFHLMGYMKINIYVSVITFPSKVMIIMVTQYLYRTTQEHLFN